MRLWHSTAQLENHTPRGRGPESGAMPEKQWSEMSPPIDKFTSTFDVHRARLNRSSLLYSRGRKSGRMFSRAHRALPRHMASFSSAAGPSRLPNSSSPTPGSSKTYTLSNYSAQRNEGGVFTTPPYSAHIKPFWRFKDEATAKKSAEDIWVIFEGYRAIGDFVG